MTSFPCHVNLIALCMLAWVSLGNASCSSVNLEDAITQQVVVVDQTPIQLSAALCFNTTITISGRTIPVTNAPTILLSSFTVENTVTYIETLNPSLTLNDVFSTITRVLPYGFTASSLNVPPQHDSEIGTKVIFQPPPGDRQRTSMASPTFTSNVGASISENSDSTLRGQESFDLPPTETYSIDRQRVLSRLETLPHIQTMAPASITTLTGIWTETVRSTVLILPTGSNLVETRLVLQPTTPESANSPRPFASIFVEITAPWTGTATTIYTVPPIGFEETATRLVLTPTNSPSFVLNEDNGPLFDDEFTDLAQPGNEEDSLLLFTPAPPNTDSSGPNIAPNALFPQLSDDQFFTSPFMEISATGTAVLPSTATVFPARPTAIGTEVVLLPADAELPQGLPLDTFFTTMILP